MAATDYVTDCRPLICSLRLPYAEAVKVFRRFYDNYPRTDVHLLEYARERAPAALPFVLRILTEVSDGSRLLLTLVPMFDEAKDKRLRAQLAMFIARSFRNCEWALQALQDRDARVRANIIEGICAWNTDAGLPLRALQDPNHRVVCNACISLVKMGHPEGYRKLCELLSDPSWQFRTAACWAFSVIGTEKDKHRIKALLSDPHPSVRSHAQRTLATLAPDTSIHGALLRRMGPQPEAQISNGQ